MYDDILDVTQNTETLGKPANIDQFNHKTTFPTLMGLEAAKDFATSLYNDAIANLHVFDQRAIYLRELAKYFIKRNH